MESENERPSYFSFYEELSESQPDQKPNFFTSYDIIYLTTSLLSKFSKKVNSDSNGEDRQDESIDQYSEDRESREGLHLEYGISIPKLSYDERSMLALLKIRRKDQENVCLLFSLMMVHFDLTIYRNLDAIHVESRFF